MRDTQGSRVPIVPFITQEPLTEWLKHPVGDATGEGVEDGVRRVDGNAVLDACQGHALLHSEEGRQR